MPTRRRPVAEPSWGTGGRLDLLGAFLTMFLTFAFIVLVGIGALILLWSSRQ